MSGPSGGGAVPLLHVITDDGVLGRPDFLPLARDVLQAGGPGVALHLRGPRTSAATLVRLAGGLVDAADGAGAWLVINDRVDVALVTGVRRVQLGARSLSPVTVRGLLGRGSVVGVSVHTAREAEDAAAAGADWLVVGTIYETSSHPHRSGAGVGLIAEVAGRVGTAPVVAIGGVTLARVAAVRQAGGHGVAVISGIWGRRDPGVAVGEYLQELQHTPKGEA